MLALAYMVIVVFFIFCILNTAEMISSDLRICYTFVLSVAGERDSGGFGQAALAEDKAHKKGRSPAQQCENFREGVCVTENLALQA